MVLLHAAIVPPRHGGAALTQRRTAAMAASDGVSETRYEVEHSFATPVLWCCMMLLLCHAARCLLLLNASQQ